MSNTATESKQYTLENLLSSVRLDSKNLDLSKPVIGDGFTLQNTDENDEGRFVSGLASLLYNSDLELGMTSKGQVSQIIARVDELINAQINEVLHNETFQKVESNWRGLEYLVNETNFKAGISLDILDVAKDELLDDFETNSVDITGSALFDKLYVKEYDQFGGHPYGGVIGLYEFSNTPDDRTWLGTMGKIANAAHTPFIGSVSPEFFGCKDINELSALKDVTGLLDHPKYGAWQKMRDTDGAAYIGLTLPRFISRLPYDSENNPCREINFNEALPQPTGGNDNYLWSSSAFLFARNLVKSFESSGWCQYLRGPKGGGLIEGLPVHSFNVRGQEEVQIPVECTIPDYRELEFANAGFMPLVYRKNSADACFFSCQSVKKVHSFKDPKDSEDSQLMANISYTFSVTRIAHYVKSIMRDNIGSSADANYIQDKLSSWLNQYVTTLANPDDLTLRYYPFKAISIDVVEKEGLIGWYDCKIAIKPHLQFEGMDVELKLDSRL